LSLGGVELHEHLEKRLSDLKEAFFRRSCPSDGDLSSAQVSELRDVDDFGSGGLDDFHNPVKTYL